MDFIEMGRRIGEFRRHRKLTQTQLSKKVGVSSNFISQIERAMSKLSVHTFYNIGIALNVSLDYLATDRDRRSKCTVIATELTEMLKQMPDSKTTIILDLANGIASINSNNDRFYNKENRLKLYKFIGMRLKQLRIEREWSQSDVAIKCDVSTNFISQIERNMSLLSLETLVRFADVFDVSIDFLTDNMLLRRMPHDDFSYKIMPSIWKMSLSNRLFILNAAKEISAK